MKRIPFLSTLLVSGLLACSCAEDAEQSGDGTVTGVPAKHQIEITASPIDNVVASAPATRGGAAADDMLALDYSGAATRGAGDKNESESAIHSLYILQFAGTANSSKLLQKSEDLHGELATNGKIDYEFATNGGTQRVYVVANMDISSYTVNTTTLSAFESAAVEFAPVTAVPASGLPMAAAQNFNPLTDAPASFMLKTPLAKLTFGCDFLPGVTTTGDLKIELKNLPNGYFAKAATVSAGAANQQPASGMTCTGTLDLLASKTAPVTYYLPANLAGQNAAIEKPAHRNKFFAPDNAMYVEITGTIKGQADSRFYLALGDGSASDFNVASNSTYSVTATIKGVNEYADLRIGGDITDLNAQLGGKTANCYIVTENNKRFAIDATVMGNGEEGAVEAHEVGSVAKDVYSPAITPSPLAPQSASILWQTNNATTYTGAVVNSAILVGGKLVFKTAENVGNAVVAVYDSEDASGDVAWSWHIWKPESAPVEKPLAAIGTVAAAGELVLMDRNLGALNATVGNNGSIGLLYQWGRKDPFPGGCDLAQAQVTMATTLVPSVTNGEYPAELTVAGGDAITPADAVKNPTTFYKNTDRDWTVRNDNLWGTPLTEKVIIDGNNYNKNKGSKSIYDPCPVGWRVPPAYAFANADKNKGGTFADNKGYSFEIGTESSTVWFPASGYRNYSSATLGSVGSAGYYWVSAPGVEAPANGGDFYLSSPFVLPEDGSSRTLGAAARCVKE